MIYGRSRNRQVHPADEHDFEWDATRGAGADEILWPETDADGTGHRGTYQILSKGLRQDADLCGQPLDFEESKMQHVILSTLRPPGCSRLWMRIE